MALTGFYQMSTHVPGFRFFASFCIGQIEAPSSIRVNDQRSAIRDLALGCPIKLDHAAVNCPKNLGLADYVFIFPGAQCGVMQWPSRFTATCHTRPEGVVKKTQFSVACVNWCEYQNFPSFASLLG